MPSEHSLWYRRILGGIGLVAATGYLTWNVWWIAQGQVPPAIFKAATGLPAPTSGGTRSFHRLLQGDWQESLRFNAMTLPILLLVALSLGWPAVLWLRGERPRLPMSFLWMWICLLLLAWVLKLCSHPRYW